MKLSLSPAVRGKGAVSSVPAFAGVLAALAGVASLAAWASAHQLPQAPLSNTDFFMKPDAASAIFLAGFSLWLNATGAGGSRGQRLARGLALAVTLLGVIAIAEHAFARDWGIDRILFQGAPGASSASRPTQVAPASGIDFVLLGLALSFPNVETRRGHSSGQYLASIAGLLPTQTLIAYAYGASPHQGVIGFAQMAPLSALAFVVLAMGILFLRPDRRPMAVLINDRPSGLLARRLMWAAVLIPFALGWLSLAGERAGWFGSAIGSSWMVGATIAVFVILVWQNAGLLHRLDEERRRAEERFTTAFRVSPEGLIIIRRRDGVILEVNEGWERLTGYGRQEAVGKTGLDLPGFLRPEARERFYARLDEEGTVHGFEIEIRRKSDETRRISLAAGQVQIEGEPCALIVVRDVTERRLAEAALRRSEEWHRVFAEMTSDYVYVYRIDADGRLALEWTSGSVERFTGYTADEFRALADPSVLIHPEDRGKHLQDHHRLKTGEAVDSEIRAVKKSGEIHWVHSHVRPVWDAAEGRVVRIFGAVQDITERKRAEAALRESETLLRALVSSLDELVIESDADGTYLNIWTTNEQLLVRPREELIGRRIGELFGEEFVRPWLDAFRRVLATGQAESMEYSIDLADGTHWFLGRINPIPSPDGTCRSVSTLSRDVTERKRAEDALRASEERFRAIVENEPECVKIVDRDGVVLEMNPAGLAMVEAERAEQVVGHSVYGLISPEHREAFRAFTERVLGGAKGMLTFEIVGLRGARRVMETHSVPLFDERGEAASVLSVTRDITERRRAEAALRASEAELRALFAAMTDVILVYDAQGRYVRIAPTNPELLYRPAGELIGKTVHEVLPAEQADAFLGYIREALAARRTVHVEYSLAIGGRQVWFSAAVSPMPDEDRVVWVARDITERRRAEAALRESEAKFRSIVETTREWIWEIDPAGRMLYSNPAIEDILGYRPEELVGTNCLALMHQEDRRRIERSLPRFTTEKRGWTGLVIRWRHKDGSYRWLESAAVPVLSDAGELIGYRGTDHDITEVNRAQEALAAETERLAVTLRSIGDGVIATGTDGRVTLINPVAERLTGWRQAEVLGRPIADVMTLVDDQSRERVENPAARVLATGQRVTLANHTLLVARDGTERIIADSGAPIRDERGEVLGVVLVFADVTEQHRMEEELARANKLESIGVLAGGIAHDFNNILTAILANVSLIKMLSASQEKTAQRLAEVEKACLRARGLTHRLLTFSKGGAPVRKPTAVGELVRDAVGFALTGSGVRPELCIPADLWPADVDAGQIEQAVQNLVINAHQAMPQGGAIRVWAENLLVPPSAALPPLAAGAYVKVAIADQGPGIPREMLGRVFDPFFTTKPGGQGLGLAAVYSILRRHAGHVTVDSTPGEGTTFTVYLPAIPAEAIAGEPPQPLAAPRRSRVLVMDDEPAMRMAVEAVLSSLGYETSLAEDGREAVAMYRQAIDAGRPFDAVILDLTVPGGMGGMEALRQLQAVDPGVRAIVSSGYANDPIVTEFRRHGFHGAVAKPYTVGELSEAVGRVVSSQ